MVSRITHSSASQIDFHVVISEMTLSLRDADNSRYSYMGSLPRRWTGAGLSIFSLSTNSHAAVLLFVVSNERSPGKLFPKQLKQNLTTKGHTMEHHKEI